MIGLDLSPEDAGTAAMFNVTRVSGIKNGVKAASGGSYATAATNVFAFTRLGGYSATFPTKGYTTSADIYLDMSQNPAAGTDLRFDWDSAISNAAGTPLPATSAMATRNEPSGTGTTS